MNSLLKNVSWMALCVSMMGLNPLMAMEEELGPPTAKRKKLEENIHEEDAAINRSEDASSSISRENPVTSSGLSMPSTATSKETSGKLTSPKKSASKMASEKAPTPTLMDWVQSGETSTKKESTNPKPSSSAPTTQQIQESETNAPLRDMFYIFNVGQGNAQLAIYTENQTAPFGVLFDCGSAAQNVHPKISQTRSEGKDFISIITKKVEVLSDVTTSIAPGGDRMDADDIQEDPEELEKKLNPPDPGMDDKELEISDIPITATKSTSRLSIGSSDSSGSYDSDRGAKLQNIGDKIKETLLNCHLSYLFVFLSHADKDHINLLSDSIPNELQTFLILGGNFIQPSEIHPERLKEDIQDLFTFMKDRNVCFSLPYCWEFPQYAQLKKAIQSYVKGTTDQILLSLYEKDWPSHQPKSLYGSMSDFLALAALYGDTDVSEISEQSPLLEFLTKMISSKISPNATASLPDTTPVSGTDPVYSLLQDAKIKKELDNVYIWALNKKSSDVNNQSTIVSLRMPSLQKSFICTGDAHEDVWSDIVTLKQQQVDGIISSYQHKECVLDQSSHQQPDDTPPQQGELESFKIITRVNDPHLLTTSLHPGNTQQYTISLVLPHHGASDNHSPVMLNLLHPHIMIASAGAGMHSHPSHSLIKKLKLAYQADIEWQQQMKDFWSVFTKQPFLKYGFLSFEKEENKPQKAYYHYLKENKPVILCTNMFGTLEFVEDAVATEYSNQIVIDDIFYKIELKKRVASTENILSPLSPSSSAKPPANFILGGKEYTLQPGKQGTKDKKNRYTYRYLSEKMTFTEESSGVYVSEKYLIKDGKIYQKTSADNEAPIYESLGDKHELVLAIQKNVSKTYVSKKLLLPTSFQDGEIFHKQGEGIKTTYSAASPELNLQTKITVDRYGNIVYILTREDNNFKNEYVVLEGEVYKKKSNKRIIYTSLKEENKDIVIQVEKKKEVVYYRGKITVDEDKK